MTVQRKSHVALFLFNLYLRPAADAHLQRDPTFQMKIRIAAEPALAALDRQVLFSGRELRTALPGPYAAAWFWRGQGLPPVVIGFTIVLHSQSSFFITPLDVFSLPCYFHCTKRQDIGKHLVKI